jgi:mono/diheme cytochrome c family protein
MDMNHEVAPKAQAIGAGGNCAACHTAGTPVIDWMQLGYTCNDPMNCRR